MTDQKIPLFNPLARDFEYSWLDDNNTKHQLLMKSYDITYFTSSQADFMAKHLADEILHEEGIKTNAQDDLKKILKRIKDIQI
jgi:hypothetical protein